MLKVYMILNVSLKANRVMDIGLLWLCICSQNHVSLGYQVVLPKFLTGAEDIL